MIADWLPTIFPRDKPSQQKTGKPFLLLTVDSRSLDLLSRGYSQQIRSSARQPLPVSVRFLYKTLRRPSSTFAHASEPFQHIAPAANVQPDKYRQQCDYENRSAHHGVIIR
ncbi:hypothetical protein Poly59_04660 [Rubripirellula reticaptiva]|uniref:Uncharacterized protein n=1 Tax=Rubripirellula reticaptiva TaxID=2528013 RepID=A0A5C6FD24_9BACT|nr:hypothetical protein Poly59_04660 [Rubripirellula reticaptiva]